MPRARVPLPPQPWPRICARPLSLSHPHPPPRSARPLPPADDPRWPGWIPTLGLELHVQLRGSPKLLSPRHAVYDDAPNTHVAPVDAALPGALPVLQPRAVHLALLACLAVDADVNLRSTFDRKHYFYPDLTSGWQVTQRYNPLAKGGFVRVPKPRSIRGKGVQSASDKSKSKTDTDDEDYFLVRLEQIQLEQDTAKSFHDPSLVAPVGSGGNDGGTLVDLNRAGAALIEIVTLPDLHSPEEAAAFVKTLQAVLRHVGASGANMDKGELRCDVNVSVARVATGEGAGPPERGTRCEVKNLNGVRFIASAIESEIQRQISLLSSGAPVPQSTRGFNALTNSTFHLRSKENAPDYRYMPDPELAPVVLDPHALDQLRRDLPELPEAARRRLRAEYGLGPREAGVLVALGEAAPADEGAAAAAAAAAAPDEDLTRPGLGVRWFEQLAQNRDPKLAANWLIHTYLGILSRAGTSLARSPIEPAELGALLDAVALGRITGTEAKHLVGEFVARASKAADSGPSATFGQELDALLTTRPVPSSASASASSGGSSSDGGESSSSSAAEGGPDAGFAALIDHLLATHPAEVAKIRAGQVKVIQRLVGVAMQQTRGQADAKRVGEELRRRLVQ